MTSGPLIFNFTITKSDVEQEYILDGFIDPTQGDLKSWANMMDTGTHFSMIVANEGHVIDAVSFRPVSAYGELGNTMPFHIKFTQPDGFDAVAFAWRMRMRG